MKQLLFIPLFFLAFMAISAQNTVTLTVKITNIESTDGSILIALCNDEDKWLSEEEPYMAKMIKAVEGSVTATFSVPVGEYAVTAFHDENNNKKLDANRMHIPKEPYGFSNGVKMPNYKKSLVKVSANTTITIPIDSFF